MKIIILAAGKGSRLNFGEPKPLTYLSNGKSILEMQIDNLSRYFSLKDIYIVVGFQKEKFFSHFPEMNYIENLNFESENTSKSLLKALQQIELDDVIWINGDVLFRPSILKRLKKQKQSTMVVNDAIVNDEEIKYQLDTQGNIVEVSKSLLHGKGEALGINYFIKEDIPALINNLISCSSHDYFEKAIELCIKEGLTIMPLFIGVHDCIEIDFPSDVVKANAMIKSFSRDERE